MAYAKEIKTTNGNRKFKIVSRPNRGSYYSQVWHAPQGWSEKRIQRELEKVKARFDDACKNGEILTHKERKEQEERERAEAAKIKTFKQYTEEVYKPSEYPRLALNTQDKNNHAINDYILPAIGNLSIREITPADINCIFARNSHKGHATLLNIYYRLNTIFKHAFMNGTIEVNPMHKVSLPKATQQDKARQSGKLKDLNGEQLAALDNVAQNAGAKWHLIVTILLETGIRAGELCGLKWGKLDLNRCTITIDNGIQKLTLQDTPTKTGNTRTIAISDETIKALLQYRQAKADEYGIGSVGKDKYIFTQADGEIVIRPDTITRKFAKWRPEVGAERLTPHMLRHTFATTASKSGSCDYVTLSQILGHSTPKTTIEIYAHTNQETMNELSRETQKTIKAAITDDNNKRIFDFKAL